MSISHSTHEGHGGNGMTFVSLYSGAGGMDLGFAGAGFRPVFANDIDPFAVKTYNTLSKVRDPEWREAARQVLRRRRRSHPDLPRPRLRPRALTPLRHDCSCWIMAPASHLPVPCGDLNRHLQTWQLQLLLSMSSLHLLPPHLCSAKRASSVHSRRATRSEDRDP